MNKPITALVHALRLNGADSRMIETGVSNLEGLLYTKGTPTEKHKFITANGKFRGRPLGSKNKPKKAA